MKKLRLTFLVLLTATAFSFYSCDLLDAADDVTLEEELTLDWNTDENADGVNVPYSHDETLKLENSSAIAPYLNKIKTIEITSITYHIENFNNDPHHSPVIMTNGEAKFGPSGSVTAPMADATGVNLQTQTTETTLNIDAAKLSQIAQMLKDNKEVKMTATGTLSKTPVSFTVVSTFHVKITANALD